MPCTTILVGKKASYDGSTIIARNDDGGFDTKKVCYMETLTNEEGIYKSKISHVEVKLPKEGFRYIASPSVDDSDGVWAASGINQKNIAMTATETITSNPRVLAADPYVVKHKETKRNDKDEEEQIEIPGGIGEEDLVYITLPYISSAREGVLWVGKLLKQYGTYEPNGMAFSDKDEIWWLETIGGHNWIAARVPDDKVVIMPNQFGLDNFDFNDAYGAKENYMCSEGLKELINDNHLNLSFGKFNPRLAFGSHSDADHIYNTPRAWFMGRYFCPRTYIWDGPNALYTPESNDIPWSFKPEAKVTIEDVRYLLTSYYQGTPYNPYGKEATAGKYRSIGVPNSDISSILQIRGYMPENGMGVEWLSLGGSAFTACFPIYTRANLVPSYLADTTKEPSTNYMYWASRIIANLVDAHYAQNIIFDERYQNRVFNETRRILNETDKKILGSSDLAIIKYANDLIINEVKKQTDELLGRLLNSSSNLMKTRYNRNDN